MRLDEDLLLDLIGACYDAALAPAGWPSVLERLSDALGGVPVQFGLQQLPKGLSWMVSVRRDSIFHRILQERFAPPDGSAVMEGAPTMEPAEPYQRHEVIDDADCRASATHRETIRPMGEDELALATLVKAVDVVVPTSIYRRISDGSFSDDELAFVRRLLPHLSRCLQIQLRLATAEAESGAIGAALDRLPLAVLLLDAKAQLLRANVAADALLRARDGLGLAGGRLVAADPRATAWLQRLVATAAETGAGQGSDAGGHLALPRAPPARPLSALVAPLPEGADHDHGLEGASAVMLVRDPDRPAAVPDGHLAALYGLTAAETRIAQALLAGESPGEIAARRGIGLATVRTHLHRVFDKTGTICQADLVRLILAGTPTLD